jgi:predicted peptidase
MLNRRIRQFVARLVLIACIAAPRCAVAADVADFIDFSLRDANGTVLLPGRLYIPPVSTSDPTVPRPLIVFLHGSGEGGCDNLAPINGNIDNLLAEAKRRSAFLYAPQAPGEDWQSRKLTDRVMRMVDRAIAEENVDPKRIYMTGLSSGGSGVWNMLSRNRGRFAAAIVIAGDTPACDFVAAHLVDTPICAFQARDDDVVPIAEGRRVMNRILAAAKQRLPSYPAVGTASELLVSNPNLESDRRFDDDTHRRREATNFFLTGTRLDLLYSELSSGGHGIWPAVYNMPAVYDWLFTHSLSETAQRPVTKSAVGLQRYCR